jgi:hypothetical protein
MGQLLSAVRMSANGWTRETGVIPAALAGLLLGMKPLVLK